MAYPEEIQWKLYRAKQHFDELNGEMLKWWNGEPGHLVPSPESTPENPIYTFDLKEPVPARFGLIAGDCLQNLRSVLDYLVWQLVIANNKKPGRWNAFPICQTPESYKQALKNSRLKGVTAEAREIIKKLQPAFLPKGPNPKAIYVLDELTNENKHRTPLITSVVSTFKPDEPLPFRHVELEITRTRNGQLIPGERIVAFVAYKHPLVERLEVMAILDALFLDVAEDTLPLFERFF
ncbi:hypothetical protein [Tunturiibacter gelidiferens]|uniref:hypothetical protein n=1 Tax=Tunturiibacter gelidiferens TaxID=3069689 RepID=UPI003D9B058D